MTSGDNAEQLTKQPRMFTFVSMRLEVFSCGRSRTCMCGLLE